MIARSTGALRSHRALTLSLLMLAMGGWGGFAYVSWSATRTERALQSQIAQLRSDRTGPVSTEKQPGQETSAARTVYPAPYASGAPKPAQVDPVAKSPATGTVASAPSLAPGTDGARPEQTPASASTPAPAPPQSLASAMQPTSTLASGDDAARADGQPTETGLVDINTASVDELNRLGGRFGRAIVAGRPYSSIDELVTKRVLTRSTFNQIKDQITAN